MTEPINNIADTIARPEKRFAMVGAERTPIIEKMFSLFIWDLEQNQVVAQPGLDPAAARGVTGRSEKAEYFFRVPPKTHDMDEPFATHITPTQGRGIYVESHGSILKEVRVTGTTGLRPKKNTSPEIPVLSITEEQLRGLTTVDNRRSQVPDSEATGIDDIIFLRNLFRLYSDNKASNELSRSRIMVWRNARTDDYWIVEPKEFKLVQNAQSPLTYQYQIGLTALMRFSSVITVEEDPQEDARDRRRFLSRLQQYSQNLTSIYLRIASAITRVQGAGYFGLSTVLGPLLSTIRGLNAIKNSSEQFYRGLTASTRDLSSAIVTGVADLVDFLPAQDPVIRDLRRALIWCSRIATEQALLDTAPAQSGGRRTRTERAYRDQGTSVTPSTTARARTFLSRTPRTDRVATDYVQDYEDIRAAARRLTGDPRRWQELVVINDLRPPYISVEGGDRVLRPGDQILYPSRSGNAAGQLTTEVNPSTAEQENAVQAQTNELIRAYGRDIGLTSVDGGLELADFAINNRGDLSTIVGIPNVEQAVRVKFATEQGELPAHPYFGALFPIGSKATIASFNEYRINAIATIQSDSRIESIESLQFNVVGDTLTVSAKLALSKTRDYLSTNFALRSV
jgi:hypothetical protein